ncbi:MAG: ABC transporter permease [Desulfobacterales bacterium]|nr:ABC transporter permease [Desulfobacterales bacterium]
MNDARKTHIRINPMLPWILPAGLILAWTAAAELRLVPSYVLPHPKEIVDAGYVYIFGGPDTGMYAGRFIADAKASLIRVCAGFAVAAAAGIPLGVMSGRLPVVERLLSTSVNGIRAVPGISWLPLALIWFGIGMKTTVFLVALAAFFPVYINAASGVRQVSPVLLRAGAMMGVRRLRGTFAILLPGAMPSLISGLRLGLGISWAYLVLGELTGVQNGLGAVIMDARMVGRTDVIIVGIVIIAVIGRISDQMLTGCLRLCFKSARRSA